MERADGCASLEAMNKVRRAGTNGRGVAELFLQESVDEYEGSSRHVTAKVVELSLCKLR